MQRERLKQGNKATERRLQDEPRRHQPAYTFRSPLLDPGERQRRLSKTPLEKNVRRTLQRSQQRPAKAGRRQEVVSYAAEETLVRSAGSRKSLPPMRSRVSNANMPQSPDSASGHSSLTAPWRTRHAPRPVQSVSPVQAISEEEQKKLAALEMQLPRVPGKIDPILLMAVLILLCIGLVMVYSASSFVAAQCCNDASYYFQKQFLGAILGLVAMLVTMRVDYRHWRRFSLIGMAIALPLLVVVLKFGTNAYGASRWLTFGSFLSFQPSELVKLVLALYIADWLARKGNQVETFLYGLAPFVILVGLVLGLVLLENDLGTAIVIAGLTTVMFFTAGANILQFGLAMVCGSLVFMTQAFRGYRLQRWISFLNPFKHVTDLNLQLYQSLLALGSGGWFGLGLGQSRQKTGYLPFPHIDSIFAIIGEELGFIGAALVIILFLVLAFRGFRLARRTQDIYGALLATGITTWLVLQAMINIGSTTDSVPYTGVPLPFISYGGTSLVISMAAVGVLLNISRYIQEPEDPVLSRRSITKNLRKKVHA